MKIGGLDEFGLAYHGDNNGNIPGNPPTSDDHKWNPNATKIVMPVSDEDHLMEMKVVMHSIQPQLMRRMIRA